MFRRLSEALPLSEASILALRPALNAPVLNVDFLPVGPARGAVVVFGEEWGGIGVAIGIRSNENGQIAVFRNQESLEPDVAVARALEPALAEAERMGFLFDEDMLSGKDGRAKAMALWGRLMGEIEMPPAPRAAPPEPAATESIRDMGPRPGVHVDPAVDVDELVLDDLAMDLATELPMDLELDAEIDTPVTTEEKPEERTFDLVVEAVVEESAPKPSETTLAAERMERRSVRSRSPRETSKKPIYAKTAALPHPTDRRRPEPSGVTEESAPSGKQDEAKPAARKLSKFRHVEDASDPGEDTQSEANGGGEALGRIPLVRVKRGRDGNKRVPYLAKLLSNF